MRQFPREVLGECRLGALEGRVWTGDGRVSGFKASEGANDYDRSIAAGHGLFCEMGRGSFDNGDEAHDIRAKAELPCLCRGSSE